MEGRVLLMALASLGLVADSAVTNYNNLVANHYEYSEKFSCVKNIDVFLDRGAFFTYSTDFLGSWPGNNNFDCRTTVFSKTKKTGIIAVIQKLAFRKVSESCKDYVQFTEDQTSRCGDIVFGLKRSKSGRLPPPPEFISAFSGLFVLGSNQHLENIPNMGQVDSRKRFVSPGAVVTPSFTVNTNTHVHSQPALEYEEDLQFMIAYTGFQDCEDTNFSADMFNCGYGVCILNIFVNDGVVNCPFGDCRDEGGCDNAIRTSPLMTGELNVTEASDSTAGRGHLGGSGVAPRHSAPVPMAYALQVASAGNDTQVIGEEMRRQNNILGKISSTLERGVAAIEKMGG